MIKFEFDERAFRRAVGHQVNDGMREIGARAQAELDAIFRKYGSQPVEIITPHLETAFRRLGWRLGPDELQNYAQAMAEGQRVVIKVEGVRL